MLTAKNSVSKEDVVQSDIARQQLMRRLADARRQSDALFSAVRVDALYDRPIPERHRIIFYLGHLEAFDWNLLHERVLGLKTSQPKLDRLFAFGIDPVGGGLPSDQPSDWPSPDIVHEYGDKIRTALDAKLAVADFNMPTPASDGFPLSTLLNVAIEHRLMHVETLSYMLHQLPLDRKVKRASQPSLVRPPADHRMIKIPAGSVTLGLARNGDQFGWDNEFEAHTALVKEFSMDRYKVTNRQFAEFIAAGGYKDRSLWSDEDWAWKESEVIAHPVFWKPDGEGWIYRAMFNEIPLPPEWPVYVSHAEADAYARWVGKLLPTEAEWQRAAQGESKSGQEVFSAEKSRLFKTDVSPRSASPSTLADLDALRWDPAPVNASHDNSMFGVADMFGNGWEWTSTVFAPFPGFEPFPFYRGYSADFFDGKHFVMKGGSPLTAACMLRPTFRNWFQPHYQYVYAGFRCVSR